jgi:hypothetical protein
MGADATGGDNGIQGSLKFPVRCGPTIRKSGPGGACLQVPTLLAGDQSGKKASVHCSRDRSTHAGTWSVLPARHVARDGYRVPDEARFVRVVAVLAGVISVSHIRPARLAPRMSKGQLAIGLSTRRGFFSRQQGWSLSICSAK